MERVVERYTKYIKTLFAVSPVNIGTLQHHRVGGLYK